MIISNKYKTRAKISKVFKCPGGRKVEMLTSTRRTFFKDFK